MRILINALAARGGGGQTILRNLLSHLDPNSEIHAYVLAPATLKVPEHRAITRVRVDWPTGNPIMRAIWEGLILPRTCKKLRADILFCPGGLINSRVPKNCRTVTMFTNMLPFDEDLNKYYRLGPIRLRFWLLRRLLLSSMIKADLTIFISEYARKVMEERTHCRIRKAVTIPHGINEHFRLTRGYPPLRLRKLPEGEYFLYVSVLDAYKNQVEVVQGYFLLKQRRNTLEKLVLAGFNATAYSRTVKREIEKLGLQDDVILTGQIPYMELPSVYAHAKINIFASTCENCPNIMLEALGAGRPLLVSNHQPMPEIGGDAVVYFNPNSPEDLANKLAAMIDNKEAMDLYARKARKRAELYDWAEVADRTWKEMGALLTTPISHGRWE